MLDLSEVVINQIVVHKIGYRTKEEGVRLSKIPLTITDEAAEDILKQYFLSHFKSDYFYSFVHESDLQLNTVYNHVEQIFADDTVFFEQSKNLAWHLYEQSNHPKIQAGEFYMVRFSNLTIEDEIVDGIGLFKSENKDTYLRVYQQNENYKVDYDNGINIKKLDKGCLIFNTEKEYGYKIAIIDNTNKNSEAVYWQSKFLNAMPCENEFYQTNQFLDLCKTFSEKMLTKENNIDKQEQVNFLKQTEAYLHNNEDFNSEEFKTNVIPNEEISEAFEIYKQGFEESRNISPAEQFEISAEALKKGKKYFRSIIKLDKNFHIYVHANPNFIEKGVDNEKGLKYYKLYFHDES